MGMTRGGLLAAGQQCDDESKCDIACPDGSNECWKQASSASLPDGPLPPIYIDMYDPDTFNWIENAPALIGLLGLLGLLGIDDDDGGSAPAPTRTTPLSPRPGKF